MVGSGECGLLVAALRQVGGCHPCATRAAGRATDAIGPSLRTPVNEPERLSLTDPSTVAAILRPREISPSASE